MQYIAFDSHKRYTLASVEEMKDGRISEKRIEHSRGNIRNFSIVLIQVHRLLSKPLVTGIGLSRKLKLQACYRNWCTPARQR